MVRRAVDGTPRFFSSLPCDQVQVPPDGIFTSEDIQWFQEEAYIPLVHLDDFIKGEEARSLTTCRFNKKKLTERSSYGSTSRLYQCHFGPIDLRGKVRRTAPSKRRTSDGKHPIARSTELGMSLQRGCQCHFLVIRYTDRMEDALIQWLHRDHFDKAGSVCHGLIDPDGVYSNSHVPHSVSLPLRQFVERLLLSKVDPVNILAAHYKMVKDEVRTDDFTDAPMLWSRDMQLSQQDIVNIKAAMTGRTAYSGKNDHINLALWVEAHPQHVLFYEPGSDEPFRPFALVVASPWQIKKLATLGHKGPISMDATFATNEYDFQLFTLLAFDEFQNGIPCAWGVLERHSAPDLITMLRNVKDRVEKMRFETLELSREWEPSCFVVDVAPEESQAIRTVFPNLPILLCFYHVRKAWRKKLYGLVKNAQHKADINRELGAMMYNHIRADLVEASNNFMQKWGTLERDFVAYYRGQWHRKLENWVRTFRQFNHANQNTNGAIERYHKTLKDQLKAEKRVKLGRKLTWLVEKLLNDVEHWFWMRSGNKSQGRECNTIAESYMMKALDKARDIPTSDVLLNEVEGRWVGRVISSSNRGRFHLVENFESDDSTCTCVYGLEGNTCKHKIKCLLQNGHGEIELMFKLGTKLGTICGGLDYARKVHAGLGVGVASVVTDVTYARRAMQPQVQPSPNTTDASVPDEEPQPRPTPPQPDVPITKDDLLSFVEDAYVLFGDNQNILKHGVRGLSSWFRNLREIDAQINPADPREIHAHMAPGAVPFRRVPSSNLSLRPLTSFVDRIGRQQRRMTRMPNPYAGQNAPKPFRKKAKEAKENWQQQMDREALEELLPPAGDGFDASQSSQNSDQSVGRGLGRGRQGASSHGRGRGRAGVQQPPQRTVLQDLNNNALLHVIQEFNFFPGG